MGQATTEARTFQIERFRKLIAAVEAAPDESFDLEVWRKNDEACGTTACAIGHYAMAHPEEGILLQPNSNGTCDLLVDGASPEWVDWGLGRHFGISAVEALNLFFPWRYPPNHRARRHVLARLKDFLAQKEKQGD